MARTESYQEYLRIIGRLKDVFGFHVDVEHENIHTFFKDKRPIFKLFFGMFTQDADPSIVVSMHVDLLHPEAVGWFINIYRLHPQIVLHDSWIEDSAGETYLGEDAMALKETYQAQEILTHWLENASHEEMGEFSKAPVYGRERDPSKIYDSQTERAEAIIEFERLRKATDDDNVH